MPTITDIDACLPQTQCTQCGYPRCREYAAALAEGAADINQCPPGGDTTIQALAGLLHVSAKALNPQYGEHKARAVAVIDEALCIGCKLCIQACPVDAILGTAKQMHTVLSLECTGCELCVVPCPMDCIVMQSWHKPATKEQWTWPEYSQVQTNKARRRTEARLARLARDQQATGNKRGHTKRTPIAPDKAQIRQDIQDALARAKKPTP